MATPEPQIPWVFYWDEAEVPTTPSLGFQVDDECMAALETLNAKDDRVSKSENFGGNPLACNPDTHPDAGVLRTWLTSTKRAPSDIKVIFWLAYFVRNEWAKLPKRTRAEHHELYLHVAKLCRDLRTALDKTGTEHLGGTGFGLQSVNTLALLTNGEMDNLVAACATTANEHNKWKPLDSSQRKLLSVLLAISPPRLPSLETLLERLEARAKVLELDGPLHAQPKKRGAERGYFVRRISELFMKRYREQPHEVIAALTTIALGEATDRELVAKLLTPRTL